MTGDIRPLMPGGVDDSNCCAIGFGFNLYVLLNPDVRVDAGLSLVADGVLVELIGDA